MTEVAGVNEETHEVFFVSTEQSPLERQLYRVRLDGKQKQRLSGGAGTHSISMSPTTAVLHGYGVHTWPRRRGARCTRATARRSRVYKEATPPDVEILPTEIVKIKATDGAQLYARMIKPAGFSPERSIRWSSWSTAGRACRRCTTPGAERISTRCWRTRDT